PALDSVVETLVNRPEGYPLSLQNLAPGDLETLRSRYWSSVSRYLQRRPGTRLVDKNPFNFCRVQLIMALFPQAKLIFVTRHPCDVVLSCFMQNFGFSDATRGFWTIGDSAAIYDKAISIWLEQKARLKPDCLDLWYEDVVADLPLQLQRIAAFLGLEVDPAMLEFHRHAQSRRINTPSYSQVVQPLYGSSVARWHRYRPWFAEVEPRLLELARRMGYPRSQAMAEAKA
ncbi:MAG TPA: sulfotransferase, partial [Nevskia sp.]|nr:sulfotransferase [Nevskia sp.]